MAKIILSPISPQFFGRKRRANWVKKLNIPALTFGVLVLCFAIGF